jgi:hypothetical protein
MSTISPPTQVVQPRPSSGRGIAIGVGGVLATVGTVVALGAGGIFAWAGTDGTLDTGRAELSTPTTALVSNVAHVEDLNGAISVTGQPKVRLTADGRDGSRVFVGVGPAAAVDRYLAGAPVDEVTDIDAHPFRLARTTHAGDATPKAPAKQSFWTAKASGRSATMNWKVRDGDYKVVVMNVDGSRDVATDADAGVTIPHLPAFLIAGLAVGLVIAGGGIALIVINVRKPSA